MVSTSSLNTSVKCGASLRVCVWVWGFLADLLEVAEGSDSRADPGKLPGIPGHQTVQAEWHPAL